MPRPVARILRPSGTLAVGANLHEVGHEWIAEMHAIAGVTAAEAAPATGTLTLPESPDFRDPRRLDLPNTQPMHADEIVDMMATYSPLQSLPEPELRQRLQRIRQLLTTHPAVAAQSMTDLPLRAQCWSVTSTGTDATA